MADLNLPNLVSGGDTKSSSDNKKASSNKKNTLVEVDEPNSIMGNSSKMKPKEILNLQPPRTTNNSGPVTSVQFQAPNTPRTDVSLMSDDCSGSPSRVHHRSRKMVSLQDKGGDNESSGTKIRTEHVANIFRHSVTTAAVTPMEMRRVKHMHDRITEGVEFSFNYNCLLFVAAMVAGLGLVSNATATIIASMLLSPIMGPVVGMAYGACISDWALAKRALRNELLSLVFCVLAGGFMGLCTGWTDLHEDWPTSEMKARANLQSLLVSIPVAFFSGLGVAISILDDQTSSLVGVAISASLLPPAVNAGILWVSFIFLKVDNDWCPGCSLYEEEDVDDEAYTLDQFRKAGGYSLGITFANIALIIVSSILMFRMKENLPLKTKQEFWTDLKVARRIYQNRAFLSEHGVDGNPGDSDYDLNIIVTPPSSPERPISSLNEMEHGQLDYGTENGLGEAKSSEE